MRLEPITSKRVKAGRTVTFTCALSEGDDVNFSWSKNGVILKKINRIDIVSSSVMSSLSVKNVQPDDAGLYVCVGRNAISEQKVSATLTVEGNWPDTILKLPYNAYLSNYSGLEEV